MKFILFLLTILFFSITSAKADDIFFNCKSGNVLRSFSINSDINKVFDPNNSNLVHISDTKIVISENGSNGGVKFFIEYEIDRVSKVMKSFFVNKSDIKDRSEASHYECKEIIF